MNLKPLSIFKLSLALLAALPLQESLTASDTDKNGEVPLNQKATKADLEALQKFHNPAENYLEPELPSWETRGFQEDLPATTNLPPTRKGGISAPFGLSWEEDPQTIKAWATRNQYPFFEEDGEPYSKVTVNGPFPKMAFTRIIFRFEENHIHEIELQFPPKYSETEGIFQFAEIRKTLEETFGLGTIQPEEKGTEPNQTRWRINRIQWNKGPQMVWLVSFQALKTKPDQSLNTLSITSIHYKNLVSYQDKLP